MCFVFLVLSQTTASITWAPWWAAAWLCCYIPWPPQTFTPKKLEWPCFQVLLKVLQWPPNTWNGVHRPSSPRPAHPSVLPQLFTRETQPPWPPASPQPRQTHSRATRCSAQDRGRPSPSSLSGSRWNVTSSESHPQATKPKVTWETPSLLLNAGVPLTFTCHPALGRPILVYLFQNKGETRAGTLSDLFTAVIFGL